MSTSVDITRLYNDKELFCPRLSWVKKTLFLYTRDIVEETIPVSLLACINSCMKNLRHFLFVWCDIKMYNVAI